MGGSGLKLSPTVGKNFSFCDSRFLRVPHSLTQRLQMKSSVTCTLSQLQYPVLAGEWYDIFTITVHVYGKVDKAEQASKTAELTSN